MKKEKYKIVKGTGGLYKISESGDVLSKRTGDWKIMKPSISDKGHAYINIYLSNKKRRSVRICVLVYETFNDVSIGAARITHLDGNKGNNHISNLSLTHYKQSSVKFMKDESEKYIVYNADTRKYEVNFTIDNKKSIIGFAKSHDAAKTLYNKYLNDYIQKTEKYNNSVLRYYLNCDSIKATAKEFGISNDRVRKIVRMRLYSAGIAFNKSDSVDKKPKEVTVSVGKHICEITFDELSVEERAFYNELVRDNGVVSHRQEQLHGFVSRKESYAVGY